MQDLEQMNSFLKAKCSLVGIAQKRRKKKREKTEKLTIEKGEYIRIIKLCPKNIK